MYCGVDLGKKGIICFLKSETDYEFIPIPTQQVKKNGKIKTEYIPAYIKDIFKERRHEIEHCVFENIMPNPSLENTGYIAAKSLGLAMGLFIMLCECFDIPYTCCGPQAWMNAMFDNWKDGSTKKRSIKASKQFNPEIDLKRTEKCTTDDHNRSDAYLMALYAKQQAHKSESYLNLYI